MGVSCRYPVVLAATQAAIEGTSLLASWLIAVANSHHVHVLSYASFLPPEFLARLLEASNPLATLKPTWNIAPSLEAPVVRMVGSERQLDALRWGLIPYFTKDVKKARKPINARSETIGTSGMFKEAFASRRCLVPAQVYYEWRDDPEGKMPFAVARVDGDPVAFAGIWEKWHSPEGETLRTFSTITTEANKLLSSIQDRMPVIIEPENRPLGPGEADGDPAILLRPASEDTLRFWPIDKKVGNVRNDGPQLIEPIIPAEASLL